LRLGNCEAVSRKQKNVAEQKRAEGEARTRFCGARAAKAAKRIPTCYAMRLALH